MNTEKKAYVAPQLQELGAHSAIVNTNGSVWSTIDGKFTGSDGKAYASYAS